MSQAGHAFIVLSNHTPTHYNLLAFGFIPVPPPAVKLNLFCSQVLIIAPSFSLLISPVIYPILRPICFSYAQSSQLQTFIPCKVVWWRPHNGGNPKRTHLCLHDHILADLDGPEEVDVQVPCETQIVPEAWFGDRVR